jgi:hypothetical protein
VEHPKTVGDRSTLAIMSALQRLGYGIYMPFGENTRCDLIIEGGGSLARVQCKTGRLRRGAVEFPICSTYGHHRNPQAYRRDYHGQVDYFAVYCPETSSVYLVPISELPGTRQAFLRVDPPRNQQRRRIRFATPYEIARVATEGLRAPPGASRDRRPQPG